MNEETTNHRFAAEKLIASLKDGDSDAFDNLANMYTGLVAKYARRFSPGGNYFDDLYQEGLLALYRAAQGYIPESSSFSAYAEASIRNGMISWVRKKSGERAADVSIDELSENEISDSLGSNPEEAYLSKLFCAELKKRAIKLLSDYERCVFLLYLEDMTSAEIAECLGKGRKSVENALCRIKQKLSRS